MRSKVAKVSRDIRYRTRRMSSILSSAHGAIEFKNGDDVA